MNMKYSLALLAAIASCQATADGFETGQNVHTKLLERERGNLNFGSISAAAYVIGVADASDGDIFCIPVGVTKGQVIQVALNYLSAHPELWNRTAGPVIIAALGGVWPCSPFKK